MIEDYDLLHYTNNHRGTHRVTRCYPLWVEHNRKKVERAMEIVAKVREENSSLRKELKDTYDQWLGEFNRKEKVITDVLNNLYELTEKINKL